MSAIYMYFLIYLVKKGDILQQNEIKKILIIRLSALGDSIHTIPLAAALRKQYPTAQLDWIVEDKAAKFIQNNPLLNNVFVLHKKNKSKIQFLKEFISVLNKIKKEKYDVVIDTQQLFKSGFILGLSGGKRKITLDCGREFSFIFANEIIKTGRKQFDINYHVVKRNLEIAKYLGCETSDISFVIPDFSSEYNREIVETINGLDKSKKTIVLAPATTWENKHWKIQGWVDVINRFKDKCNIVVTAAEKEKSYVNEILSSVNASQIIDLTGKTTLSDLVYVYKNADIVVSPDSGSAHTAWVAQAKAVLTLFFATSANRTAPFGENYFSISAKCDCAPCMKKRCKLSGDKNKCIDTIKSDEVVNLIEKVLQ